MNTETERQTEALIRQAGELMLGFRQLQVTSKGRHGDYVTQADKAVQDLLLSGLSSLYPEAAFIAEEKDNGNLPDTPAFIIDPIDGTTNFFRHRESSVISVGLTVGKYPAEGWIFNPYRGEMFHAVRGKGAFLNGERISVSSVPAKNALVYLGTSSYYEELMELTGLSALRLLPRIADFRRTGSCALELCDIAQGKAEALFEWRLQPWDTCAGTLLVEEAGGRCGHILEGDVTFTGPVPFLAANSESFDEIRDMLRAVYKEWSARQADHNQVSKP